MPGLRDLIRLDGIGKTYPMPGEDVHALKNLTLEIERGEFVAVVGASGSGKTTLLYLLGMLTAPTAGRHFFGEQDVALLSDAERSIVRGQKIGFVFQSFHLLPQVSVLENVLLATRYERRGGSREEFRRAARELIERVGLGHRVDHRPWELSGGEMQRVAIARALLNQPDLILADEPTGNLDGANGDQVFELLEGLAQDGHTVVLVTHDLGLAGKTPRRIQLKDGEVIDDLVATA